MKRQYFKTSLYKRLRDCIDQNKEFTLVNPSEAQWILRLIGKKDRK
jgi:hypothetical protein